MTPCFGSLHCTRYTKHAKYINHCYPTKEGEKGPRPSELSYLTFYASTRPAKLTKVGSYLVRRVKRDIAKGRKQLVIHCIRLPPTLFFRLAYQPPLSSLGIIDTTKCRLLSLKSLSRLVIEISTCFPSVLSGSLALSLTRGILI